MIIKIENLDVFYGHIKALDGISCTFPMKKIGLLGKNGAGKTTLLKTILGLIKPNKGSCNFDIDNKSFDSYKEKIKVRSFIGYMPERDVIIPELSALDFVVYGALLNGIPKSEAKSRAHSVLYYCGLEEVRYRKVGSFSTGMKQKVKLAQAIVSSPKLLLLDEPTSGLDPQAREDMLKVINQIPEDLGASFILSTHILPDIEKTCEYLILLDNGKTKYEGDIQQFLGVKQGIMEVIVEGNEEKFIKKVEEIGGTVLKDRGKIKISLNYGTSYTLSDNNPFLDSVSNQIVYKQGQESTFLFVFAADVSAQIRHIQPEKQNLEMLFNQVQTG